jgi:hypothetical protein
MRQDEFITNFIQFYKEHIQEQDLTENSDK